MMTYRTAERLWKVLVDATLKKILLLKEKLFKVISQYALAVLP
jgi:hypothetical protein